MKSDPNSGIFISREAAEKAFVDADTVKALEAHIKILDQAIGDYKKLLNDLRIELAYKFGENTVLKQNSIRDQATIPVNAANWRERLGETLAVLIEKLGNIQSRAFVEETENELQTPPGLTRQLAMMLVDELFPNLANASNTAKAEFLSLLTGWNADGLRNKWSDYRRGDKDSLAQDAAKVTEWKMKLKISDQQK